MSDVEAAYTTRMFEVQDIDQAKQIILTPAPDQSTNDRWEKETPYVLGLLENIPITEHSLVMDFGCGVGRLSKEIIGRYDCQVVGVDISMNMRALANVYCNSNKFIAIPSEKSAMELFRDKVDVVIAVWALQHVLNLDEEIARIKNVLREGGGLFILNERRRFVPTTKGWMDDKQDIFMALQKNFRTHTIDVMDETIAPKGSSSRTFWGVFSK
jgi:cyclopropane fatty-acyl-phospholipid synthase-like methyltransferase